MRYARSCPTKKIESGDFFAHIIILVPRLDVYTNQYQ